MPDDKPKIDKDEAKKVLLEEQKKRVEACEKEIKELLEKHKCMIAAQMLIGSGRVDPIIQIVPQPEK